MLANERINGAELMSLLAHHKCLRAKSKPFIKGFRDYSVIPVHDFEFSRFQFPHRYRFPSKLDFLQAPSAHSLSPFG